MHKVKGMVQLAAGGSHLLALWLLRLWAYQKFLTAALVRPGSIRAIAANAARAQNISMLSVLAKMHDGMEASVTRVKLLPNSCLSSCSDLGFLQEAAGMQA